MLQINIARLMTVLRDTTPFTLPAMNEGVNYLYENIYTRLSEGEDVRLSRLDLSAFTAEDIRTFDDLYDNIFEGNNCQGANIVSILRNTEPTCKATTYV